MLYLLKMNKFWDDVEAKSNDDKSKSKSNKLNKKQYLDLKKELLTLPEELHRQILKQYKKKHLVKQIESKKDEKIDWIKWDYIDNIIYPPDFHTNFCDLYDFNTVIKLLREYKEPYVYNEMSIYSMVCLMSFMEYFNSLTYGERQEIYDIVLQGNKYEQFVVEYRERMMDLLIKKKYIDIVDPEGRHSGASFGWILSNLMPMIFGSYIQKMDHWVKLIKGHF